MSIWTLVTYAECYISSTLNLRRFQENPRQLSRTFYYMPEGNPVLEVTASSVSAEIKQQIVSKLPKQQAGGSINRFVVKAKVNSAVSTAVYFEAIGILLQQLADEYPEWEIGLEGEPDDLELTFSK